MCVCALRERWKWSHTIVNRFTMFSVRLMMKNPSLNPPTMEDMLLNMPLRSMPELSRSCSYPRFGSGETTMPIFALSLARVWHTFRSLRYACLMSNSRFPGDSQISCWPSMNSSSVTFGFEMMASASMNTTYSESPFSSSSLTRRSL